MIALMSPGATFAGYRVEALVGRGGMGVVYRATDLSLERPVALKLIAPELTNDERFRARFLREPRLAASLDHPNVVPIYQAGEHGGQLYLAMRFVAGSDLASVLERHRTLTPDRAVAILAQIAGALDAAHRRGLVHRDVKPANVLLDEEEHAYLTDFGITKQVRGVSTETGGVIGTLDYLAPEQIRGEKVDGRADCYALACVLYECLAGAAPFRRQSEAETLWAHMQEEPAAPAGYQVLDPVFRTALAKDRDERFPSCSALLSASRRALEQPAIGLGAARAAPERAAPARDPDMPVSAAPTTEERKVVTVLFAELGFKSEFERDPERLRDFVDRVRAVAGEELEVSGGTVDSALGDAVLATFGLPVAQEDHAERALHAALATRSVLASRFGEALSLRIGVESGQVIAGAPPGGRPTVTGQPLVAAGRLARNAAGGEILVGERTAHTARGAFELRRAEGGHRLVRGLARVRPRGVRELGRAFVGREPELALLQATYDRVADQRQAHLATIVGDAGVGKTSLVHAWRERLAPGDTRWYTGHCLAYGRAITYHPLSEILRERFDVRPSDPPEVVRARLGEKDILGLTLGLDPPHELHPHEARERLHEAWIGLLEEICSDGPATVVVEDLHWAEPALLELLGKAARDVRSPLLILTTARPELIDRQPDWGVARGSASRLWLEPLSAAEAEQMLAKVAGELPDPVRRLVLKRAEGNPFFLEEVLGSLLDRGVLRREAGRWVASGVPATLEVADSVQGVIGARIDLLPAVEKSALQAAAVIGRSFWEGAVRALVETTEPDLRLLEERDFVRRSPQSSLDGEREYLFKHALTREVAYGSLPAGRRAWAHADFAEWLERAGGGADEHAPQLAHHYAEAVAPEHVDLAWAVDEGRAAALRKRAVSWLRRAAELAFGRYELADAAAMYRQAVELEPDAAARSELWAASAWASMLRFDTDDFRDAMEHALELQPPRRAAARLYAELSREGSRPYMWKHPPPRDVVEQWIENALELAEPGSEARAAAVAAWAHLDPPGRADAVHEAVELAEQLGDSLLRADAYEARAKLAVAQGRLAEAGTWADRKLALIPRIADPDRRSAQCVMATFVYLRQGRISDGRRAAELHDEITSRLTPHHEVHAAAFLLLADTICGDWVHASGLSGRAEAACAANSDTPCQFNWRALLMAALGYAQLGDDREARRLEELAAESLTLQGPLAKEPALLRIAMLRGDLDAVERLLAANPEIDFWDVDYPAARLDALAAVRDRRGVEGEAPRALDLEGYVEPFAMRALGIVREDRSLLDRSAMRFEELGLGWRAAETRALLAVTRLEP
jgi:class 3 adenylate cyclase/tetratricopeptide (TPR) repeat protein